MSTTNWKSIFNGVAKTQLKKFVSGNIGSRSLINSTNTKIARSELYRLERNNSAQQMRKLVSRALSR